MPREIDLHLNLPAYPGLLILWNKKAMEAAQKAKDFCELASFFAGRDLHDCRLTKIDEESGERTYTGAFYDAPLRRKILYGTELEREKGFFIDESSEDDGTTWTKIRNFTLSGCADDSFQMPRTEKVQIDGHYVLDPATLAYEAMVNVLGLKPASHIFIVSGHGSGEHAMFCFPFYHNNLYLIYTVGGRYFENHIWIFQGDPKDLAKMWKRHPRNAEEFSDWRDQDKVYEVPNLVPMTYNIITGDGPRWTNPSPVELKNISTAVSALLAGGLLDEKGEPYLTSR